MAQSGSARSRAASEPPSPWREPVRGGHPDPELLALSRLTEASLRDDSGALIAHGCSLRITLPPVSPSIPAAPPSSSSDDEPAGPDPWEREPAPSGLAAPPLYYFTGLEATGASAGEAQFALPANPWFCAPPPGRVQGRVVALLADAALSGAVRSATPAGVSFTPLELKLNYLRPLCSDGREARARGRLIHSGRRIAVMSAEVRDADGVQVAFASGPGLLAPGPR